MKKICGHLKVTNEVNNGHKLSVGRCRLKLASEDNKFGVYRTLFKEGYEGSCVTTGCPFYERYEEGDRKCPFFKKDEG